MPLAESNHRCDSQLSRKKLGKQDPCRSIMHSQKKWHVRGSNATMIQKEHWIQKDGRMIKRLKGNLCGRDSVLRSQSERG